MPHSHPALHCCPCVGFVACSPRQLMAAYCSSFARVALRGRPAACSIATQLHLLRSRPASEQAARRAHTPKALARCRHALRRSTQLAREEAARSRKEGPLPLIAISRWPTHDGFQKFRPLERGHKRRGRQTRSGRPWERKGGEGLGL